MRGEHDSNEGHVGRPWLLIGSIVGIAVVAAVVLTIVTYQNDADFRRRYFVKVGTWRTLQDTNDAPLKEACIGLGFTRKHPDLEVGYCAKVAPEIHDAVVAADFQRGDVVRVRLDRRTGLAVKIERLK